MNHTRWRLARERKVADGYAEPLEVMAEREQIRLAHDLGGEGGERRCPGLAGAVASRQHAGWDQRSTAGNQSCR